MFEELALGRLGEPVQLERVLANVQVGVERDLAPRLRLAERAQRRLDAIADAVDVEDDPVEHPRDDGAPQRGDHPVARRSSGAIAWQIATASASAA